MLIQFFAYTWFLCPHKIALGGSGKCFTMHVRLIVEPMSIYKSGPPKIDVTGSVSRWYVQWRA